MPNIRKYNKGSIIYFQGDIGGEVYVLQKGDVILISTEPYKNEEIKERVNVGEFFGMGATLGRYPHAETAQAASESSVVVFKAAEFEQYAIKNTHLIMKMIRLFSKKLRNVHRQVRSILNAGEEKNAALELLNVAEAFYRNHQLEHAIYAFNRYLEYNPEGVNRQRAQELRQQAKEGRTFPSSYPPPEPESSLANLKTSAGAAGEVQGSNAAADNLSAEQRKKSLALREIYEAGKNAQNSSDQQTALRLLTQCANSAYAIGREENKIVQDAYYRKGIIELKMGKLTNAATTFSEYIKQFPDGLELKRSLLQLGVITELRGDIKQAKSFYSRVATMLPHDEITKESRKRLESLT